MKRRLSVLFALVILGGVCSAQDTIRSVVLDSVNIRAEKVNITDKAPSGDVLTEKNLQVINTQSIGDAAKFLSGVIVKDYGGLGGIKTVSVRGLSSNHTAVLYDGVNLFDNQSGQIDLSKYSLSSVSSLSLANSQFTPTLPTATSLASASSVNIETKKPVFTDRDFNLNASLSYGSFNMGKADVDFSARLGSKDIVSFFADAVNTDGKYPYKLYYGAYQNYVTEERIRKNNDLFSCHGESNWFHTFSTRNSFKLKTYWYSSERGLPSSVALNYDNSSQRLWNRNFFAQSSFLSQITERLTYKNNFKFDYNFTHYSDPDYLGYPDGENDLYTQRFFYNNNALALQLGKNVLLTLTNDLSYNTLYSSSTLEDEPQRFSTLTAMVLNVNYGRFLFTADVVHSLYSDNYLNESDVKNHLSPYISVKYSYGNYTFSVFYKNIFRMPTFNELYYRNVGSRTLKPEKTNQFSVSNTLRFNRGIFSIVPEIDIYYNDVTDKIVSIPKNVFLWSMLNYGRVHIYGTDVKLSFSAAVSSLCDASLKLNFSYQHAEDVQEDSYTYGQLLPYMPEFIGSAVADVRYGKFRFGYTALYVGKRYSLQENTAQNLLNAYTDHSANISYSMNVGRTSLLSFMFSVNNIFNTQYEVVRSYPMIGRNFMLKISYRL